MKRISAHLDTFADWLWPVIRPYLTAFFFVTAVFISGFVFGLGNRPHLVRVAYGYGFEQGALAPLISAICGKDSPEDCDKKLDPDGAMR